MKMDVSLSPQEGSGQSSRASSLSSRLQRSGSNMSIDLSSLPPLVEPTPPTNTLLIINLNNPEIFRPDHLESLRALIDATAPVMHWSPLKSFRRIVTTFTDEQDAIKIRTLLDGENIMGERIRVYFGRHTPIVPSTDNHLAAPESKKLFFISPPPSPPHGWTMRNEEPPNEKTHAEDLAEALKKLSWNTKVGGGDKQTTGAAGRERSGSTTVLLQEEGDFPGIVVDDMSDGEGDQTAEEAAEGYVPVVPIDRIHTSRPPVETMLDA